MHLTRHSPAGLCRIALLLGVLGCGNAGDQLGFGVPGVGGVNALICLDRDLSRSCTLPDTFYAGITVGLVPLGTQDTLVTAATDAQGLARFTGVPVGKYRLIIDTTTIGDSLVVQGIDSTQFTVTLGGQGKVVPAEINWPVLTVAQARVHPAGKRVWIEGVLLSPINAFGDTTAHISDSTGALRLTNAVSGGALFPGDSVRVFGTVNVRIQPVLDAARVSLFHPAFAGPTGDTVSTALAATAAGGQRDADLVSIVGGVIVDTATVGPDFLVQVNDGSGVLDVLLDGDINFNLGLFIPGKTVAGEGVLVPSGQPGSWQLKPRVTTDVTVS